MLCMLCVLTAAERLGMILPFQALSQSQVRPCGKTAC